MAKADQINTAITAYKDLFIPDVNYTPLFTALKAAFKIVGRDTTVLDQQQLAYDNLKKQGKLSINSITSALSPSELNDKIVYEQRMVDQMLADLNKVTTDYNAATKVKGADLVSLKEKYSQDLLDAIYGTLTEVQSEAKNFASYAATTQTDISNQAQQAFNTYKATGSLPKKLSASVRTEANKLVADYQTTRSNNAAAQNAFDEWKRTGLDPANLTVDARAAYDVLKNKALGVASGTEAPAAPKAPIFSTATDLAGALKDYGRQGLLPDKRVNAPLYNQLLDYIAAGRTDTTQAPADKPTNVQVQLPQDYGTRMAIQDRMVSNAEKNPNMYAPGQFDPLYSGFMMGRANTPVLQPGQPNLADPVTGVFKSGALTASPFQGFGFQNAYDPSQSPQNVTGVAAGGYLDAQTIGQQNQQLQAPQNNYSLGLGAIPNMTEYTNYGNNPGITTPTQDTDDGGVGGVPVPGQTNPVW